MARGIFSCFGRPFFLSSSSTASSSNAPNDDTKQQSSTGPGPVVVELFSSQGCATSPVAELLISRLGRGDFKLEMPLVMLAYHVDYWNHAGWKDPFGSSLFTVRQKSYVEAFRLDTLSTPQVVVQGKAHCIGDDEDALLATINSAPRFPGLAFQATFALIEQQTLQVSLTGSLENKDEDASVIVALYESGLVTDCRSGVNKGRVLSNDYVVRKLEKLGSVKEFMFSKKSATETFELGLWEGFSSSKCGVALFVQNHEHHIFGSQNFTLPHNLSNLKS